MKNIKLLLISLLLFVGIFLVSCENAKKPIDQIVNTLSIFTMNDLHGQITENDYNQCGISRMAGFINEEKKKSEASVVLAAGDMFQGTGVSNYANGECVIPILNKMNVDAMTCGNHEFDWGLDTITNYFGRDTTKQQAEFPLLGANIYQLSLQRMPDYMNSSTIIKRENLTIGIVGYIGYGEEEQILASRVEDFKFLDPIATLKPIIKDLRKNKGCDVIIAMGHDSSSYANNAIAKFPEDSYVDVIVNAHSHQTTSTTYLRGDNYPIPCVQAGSYSNGVGVINLTIDDTKKVTGATSFVKSMKTVVQKDSSVDLLVDKAVEDCAPIMNRVIGQAGSKINRIDFAGFALDSMEEYFHTDVAFCNYGGFRTSAFPIAYNSDITISKVYSITPFDNTIMTFKMKGSDIRSLVTSGLDCVYSSSLENVGNNLYINGKLLNDNGIYFVSAIDYIYQQSSYPFQNVTEVTTTGVIFRDLLINKITQLTSEGKKICE